MAVSTATVSAAELAAYNADKPMFVGNNVLEIYNAVPRWSTTGSWASGSDVTDSNGPTRRLFDRHGVSQSYPTDQTSNVYYVLFNLQPSTEGRRTIDTVLLWNHNFGSMTGTGGVLVSVQLADNNTFTTNVRTIYNTTVTEGSANKRIYSTNLMELFPGDLTPAHARFTNVQWARLIVATSNASNFTTMPKVGELFLGRRRQMSYHPDVPWEYQGLVSDTVDFVARSGVRTRYTRSRGRREFSPVFRSPGADPLGLNQETELRSLYYECDHGTKPILVFPRPISLLTGYVCYWDPPVLNIPILGPYEREASMHLVETAPYSQTEQDTYPT